MREGTCESCGSVTEIVWVRRFYVTPERWDTEGSIEPGDQEWWCFACRTHYPHQLLDGDGRPVGDPET